MQTEPRPAPIVVASTSLQALFEGKSIPANDGSAIRGRISLPEYQRPYSWGPKQLVRLMADLEVFAMAAADAASRSNDFYLGSIILHQSPAISGSPEVLNIIDGQQRLTSMALLGCLLRAVPNLPGLRFSPRSQGRIRTNAQWLKTRNGGLPKVDFSRVNVTLVVTRSEDDAYRFFETQNTGGVRLDGPAIIKAHHLRAVKLENQDACARQWEALGDLGAVVEAAMKARHWQSLHWRDLASHRESRKMRDEVVAELRGKDGADGVDIAYRAARFSHDEGGWKQQFAMNGYAMRQPLNAGINSIRYLEYFHGLRNELFVGQCNPTLKKFYALYHSLTVKAKPSDFLNKLFDAALLLYASQFGKDRMVEVSLWLFRAIASPRLSNKTTVRESTVQAFARASQVLDQIVASYSHDELMAYLQSFSYVVDPGGLDGRSVKRTFIRRLAEEIGMDALPTDPNALAQQYDDNLVNAIHRLTNEFRASEKDVA